MKHLKTLLLITLTLGFTSCSDKDKPCGVRDGVTSNTNVNTTAPTLTNTTTPTQTPTPPTIDPNTPSTYKSLTLSAEQTTLNKDDNTSLKLLATSSDGTSKELNTDIDYIITPNGSAEVNNNILIVKQDGTLTIQAKTGNTLSNTLTLTVTWTVGGHTLPPEPNKALNDATLLGIDVNNNNVRDDVERWIYEEYKDKHPIYIDIAMQASRGYKKVLETPEKAKEIYDEVDAAIYCEIHYRTYYKYCGDRQLISEDRILSDYFIRKIYFNTAMRENKYLQFDKLLSGDSYTTPKPCEGKKLCDFNTSKYGEE